MKNTGDAIGDLDGTRYPFSMCSFRNLSSSSCSLGDMGYDLIFHFCTAPGSRSMAWSQGWCCGSRCDSFSEKTLAKSRYCGGTISSNVLLPLAEMAFLAICWE